LLAVALLTLPIGACAPVVKPARTASVQPLLGRAHFAADDGAVLPVRSWLPASARPRAIILALHGFNDYSNAFTQPGQYLSARGIAVFAFDQRGFGNAPGRGLWAGMAAYVADVAAMARQLRMHYPGVPVYLLGESMGGAVAIVVMTSAQPPADGLILSAPAVWARDMMPWYQRAVLALAASTLPELELTGSGLKILASDNIEMLRGLGRDPLVIKASRVDAIEGLTDLMDAAQAQAGRLRAPILVLYGQRDQVIPDEPIQAMLEKLPRRPETRMVFYPNGYHLLLRDLHASQPLGDITAWIEDRKQPLPSGFERHLSRGFRGGEPPVTRPSDSPMRMIRPGVMSVVHSTASSPNNTIMVEPMLKRPISAPRSRRMEPGG
jgi:alpha-beta hydrolase superfamily lysophospholipase